MKKLIIIFLSIFIAIPNVHAADEDLSCTAYINGSCPPGCYPFAQQATGFCFKCEPGTYSDKDYNDVQECLLCAKPSEATFTDGEDAYGNTSDNCPWEVTCGAGQYWNDDEAQCTDCGDHYQDGNGTCTVIGRGNNNAQINYDSPSCDFGNRCIGNEYKLILKPNGAIFQGDIELCYKYGTGFAEKCGSIKWSQNLPKHHKDRPMKPFTGYYSDKNCSQGSLVFRSNSSLVENGWSLLGGDKTLYACWDKLTQTIKYYDETEVLIPGSSHTCTADDNDNFECIAKAYQPTGNGVIFENYKCEYTTPDSGNNRTSCGTVGIGGDIPERGNATIYLTIQTDPCPAGYYCEAGTPTSCPGGSTSDTGETTGAENIKDCYMAGGEDGTQFCDSVGCFNLPDGIKIYYQGGDEANN